MNAPKGFEADNVLVGRITLPPAKYQIVDMMQRFLRGVLDQMSPTPGVIDVAATAILPLETETIRPVVTDHSDAAKSWNMPLVTMRAVSSEYLKQWGIPLRQGRFFPRSRAGACRDRERIGGSSAVAGRKSDRQDLQRREGKRLVACRGL
jgi:hypothetical protein